MSSQSAMYLISSSPRSICPSLLGRHIPERYTFGSKDTAFPSPDSNQVPLVAEARESTEFVHIRKRLPELPNIAPYVMAVCCGAHDELPFALACVLYIIAARARSFLASHKGVAHGLELEVSAHLRPAPVTRTFTRLQ